MLFIFIIGVFILLAIFFLICIFYYRSLKKLLHNLGEKKADIISLLEQKLNYAYEVVTIIYNKITPNQDLLNEIAWLKKELLNSEKESSCN